MALENEVQESIAKLAEQAGQRAQARALWNGATSADAELCATQCQQEVHERLIKRFRETGELPPTMKDIDVLQPLNQGRVAPPVITVINYKFDATDLRQAILANLTEQRRD